MRKRKLRRGIARVALGAMLSGQFAAPIALAQGTAAPNDNSTTTPITHLIVLIGENRSFDHVFATYRPKGNATVTNLLSNGIILADGSPGPNAGRATQFQVNTPLPATYFISASTANKTPYSTLPPPHLNGAPNQAISLADLNANPTGVQPPFDHSITSADLTTLEPSVAPYDLDLMRTGATGALGTTGLDTRIPNATSLPNTEFQLTGPSVPYDSYTGDTVHRLFHMWQQTDCNIANATPSNPSGCLNDLYPFVATARDDSGGNSMGFYNMQNGDVPLLEKLAGQYTMSDNYHQAIMGGTAANHVALGTGDFMSWTTFAGLTQPPSNIANPNPQSSTSDKYLADKVSRSVRTPPSRAFCRLLLT